MPYSDICGGKLLVAVTRERRYGPSRLRVNDDDDDSMTYLDAEVGGPLLAADVPQQSVGRVGAELDAHLFRVARTPVVARQPVQHVLQPRVAVEHEALARARRQRRQRGRLPARLALRRPLVGRLVGDGDGA